MWASGSLAHFTLCDTFTKHQQPKQGGTCTRAALGARLAQQLLRVLARTPKRRAFRPCQTLPSPPPPPILKPNYGCASRRDPVCIANFLLYLPGPYPCLQAPRRRAPRLWRGGRLQEQVVGGQKPYGQGVRQQQRAAQRQAAPRVQAAHPAVPGHTCSRPPPSCVTRV